MITNRLFIAIRVPEIILPQWKQAQLHLKKDIKSREYEVNWTPFENYHITLQFLGDSDESKIDLLKNLLQNLAQNFPPFDLAITGMSAFADLLHARVLYLGVQNKKVLRSLHAQLVADLNSMDFHSHHSDYNPHMTILRFRNPHAVKDLISPFERKKWGKVHVNELVLFKSELKGHYPVYTPLITVPLTGTVSDNSEQEEI